MRFSRRLITPVLAAVMLVGGAAFAQETIYDTLDGETVDLGIISWSYDPETRTFTWGDLDGCEEVEASTDPVVDELLADIAPDGELHFDTNCRTVSFGDSDYTAEVEDPGDDTEEPNHGQMVSGFGEQLREVDKDELDGNRGSFISEIAKLFKNEEDDDEGPDLESDDLDEDSDDDSDSESDDLDEDPDDDADSEDVDDDPEDDEDSDSGNGSNPDKATGKPEK